MSGGNAPTGVRANAQSAVRTIGLVAGREFTTRVLNKAFLISTAVVLVAIVGGQIAIAAFGDSDDRPTVGVVGGSPALSEAITQAGEGLSHPVELKPASDENQARQLVEQGDLDVALISASGGRYTAIAKSEVNPEMQAVLNNATQKVAFDGALAAQNVDPKPIRAAAATAVITVVGLDPADPDKEQRVGLAYVAVMLLFFSVYLYGLYVAMGVVEEKSSRVVELLLATITPLHLLLGKVIGIGAVGLVQVLVLGGAALATGLATGLVTIGGTAVALFLSVLVWYVLGFAFFAVLYAALGSLVSRQEDVNSATTPLSLLAFAVFFVAQFSLNDPDSTWVRVLAWIPPFSSMLMPIRIASDLAGPVQFVVTVLTMLVVTALVAVLAARIYERSVLHTGARMSLRQVLSKAS